MSSTDQTDSNGWIEYKQLVLNHLKKEEERWTRIEDRLGAMDRKLAFWGGGLATLAIAAPIVIGAFFK